MSELIATYTVRGEHHRLELVDTPEGRLLLDRGGSGAPRVVAELGPDEHREQAEAVLDGDGAYLRRARAGEPGLCRPLGARPAQAEAA